MSFYGTSFSFDGVSCEEYGLMLYDFDSTTQSASSWATGTKINEERIAQRFRSIYYGKTEEAPLEFTLVFGADEYAARGREPLDRYEMQAIAKWLTGPKDYRYLQIDQPDMADIRYRCVITNLQVLEYAGKKWAFSCKVHCDSPYAYTTPKTYTMDFAGLASNMTIYNPSSIADDYKPKITLTLSEDSGNTIAIYNRSNGTALAFDGLPIGVGSLIIDCERCIITSESGINMYQYVRLKDEHGEDLPWNPFDFITLAPGTNAIHCLVGSGKITFECEFPMNVGG